MILRSPLFWLALAATAIAPGARADDSGKEITIEEFLQQLSTVQGVVQRKDPFAEMAPPFEMPRAAEQSDDPNAPVLGAPVLERFATSDYEVVAVLLGDKYPRALVRLPPESPKDATNRKVVIVKEGDKLGNRKGVISKIVLEGVIVQQAVRGPHGFVDKSEVLLKVGGRMEDQRRSLQTKTISEK